MVNLKDLDDAWEESKENEMHSHDKTMLAKLGFADPDKKDPHHDQACLYLTQPETCERVSSWLSKGIDGTVNMTMIGHMEQHLQKGEGQYATTIGFLDVVFSISAELVFKKRFTEQFTKQRPEHGESRYGLREDALYEYCGDYGYWTKCEPYTLTNTDKRSWKMFAEVKIGVVGIGEVLRQLNLYLSYFDRRRCSEMPRGLPVGILVAPWDLSPAESRSLSDAGYGFLKLGQSFKDWVAAQSKKTTEKGEPTFEV